MKNADHDYRERGRLHQRREYRGGSICAHDHNPKPLEVRDDLLKDCNLFPDEIGAWKRCSRYIATRARQGRNGIGDAEEDDGDGGGQRHQRLRGGDTVRDDQVGLNGNRFGRVSG